MSEKKYSTKYLNEKMKKETFITIETLEERMNTVKDKINIIDRKLHRKKQELKRGKLPLARKKEFELNIIELKNNLEVILDFKNELQTRLDNENKNLSNLKEQIRGIRKHGQTNPFDFTDISKDNDIDLKQFFDIAENNITFYENEPRFNVITDAGKDKYPFILKGYTTINDSEPVEINRFYKDVDQLRKSIEKMVDKYDETLEVLFSGEMINYTLVFNKGKRSNYGTGCDIQQKIIEYRSDLVDIPEANERFRKCIEFIYQKDYSQEYREFKKQ